MAPTVATSTDPTVCQPGDVVQTCDHRTWHEVQRYHTLCSGWDAIDVPFTIGPTGDVSVRAPAPG